MFFDFRQDPGKPQHSDPKGANYVYGVSNSRHPTQCQAYETRTLDLYPRMPEFFCVCELHFPKGLPAGDEVLIHLGRETKGWQLPNHPIDEYRFWFLENLAGELTFEPTGYRTYRIFNHPEPEKLQDSLVDITIKIEGEYPQLAPSNTRPTPGILWGDIHGMAFNQRPLDDFYHYARDIAKYDFAAAMLFSYNTCVKGIWNDVKEAAKRWTDPGRFLAIVGVEAATVPDGSHRNAYFFDPDSVPPIFCEDRPPARDDRLTRRFDPDTIICDNLDAYYAAVARYDGIVTGHFHTLDYQQEIIAEIWQKQVKSYGDEPHIFDLLNRGFHLGIVAGSDTHDSMPGNPDPEPYCPQPAGFMAVYAEEVSATAIREAIVLRRVYGTSGARIILGFSCGEEPMGSVLPFHSQRCFHIHVEGTATLKTIEIIRDGQTLHQFEFEEISFETTYEDTQPDEEREQWYVIIATQADGHRAWSSPIWFQPQTISP
jgi:hypothetical protein